VEISQGERSIFGVNVGHPIVTNEDFVAYLCKVCEAFKLPFGVLSGVGQGMGVLHGDPRIERERGGFGSFSCPLV